MPFSFRFWRGRLATAIAALIAAAIFSTVVFRERRLDAEIADELSKLRLDALELPDLGVFEQHCCGIVSVAADQDRCERLLRVAERKLSLENSLRMRILAMRERGAWADFFAAADKYLNRCRDDIAAVAVAETCVQIRDGGRFDKFCSAYLSRCPDTKTLTRLGMEFAEIGIRCETPSVRLATRRLLDRLSGNEELTLGLAMLGARLYLDGFGAVEPAQKLVDRFKPKVSAGAAQERMELLEARIAAIRRDDSSLQMERLRRLVATARLPEVRHGAEKMLRGLGAKR
ncbi:MAG: hypothetical protein IJU44_10780 [Kiritimatiellae bacterium]|nr:hypothetical protein [Kiritimatiellia bacterium]